MNNSDPLHNRCHPTRRSFLQLGSLATVAWNASPLAAAGAAPDHPLLKDATAKLEYLHPLDGIKIADKGRTGVLKFSPEKLREVGLVPQTWSLEIVADTESTSVIEQPFTRAQGNALDWKCLMKLAERHAVRFLHPCICAFGDDPFHNSLWEGVPLREIIWMAKPKANIRRVVYQSYHPEGLPPFQASLPLAQVLETPPGQVPPVLAYKMNGELIPAAHGGPARVVVPGMYGDKAIKWIQRIVLTNDFKANDSDAAVHNADTESPMKTKARFVNAPKELKPGSPAALTGYALVGISGLAKVQYCVHSHNEPRPSDDPYWTKADWHDATILPAPTNWGRGIAGGKLPPNTSHMDPVQGTPLEWPIRFTLTHWAALLPGLPAGTYDICCRTIDHNGIAQPMPRPFPRSGNNGIHHVTLTVKA